MPTSAYMTAKLRALLDDETSLNKQGQMWSDTELWLALDAAQLAFARYCYLKEQWHLLARLHTSVTDNTPAAIPANYMFYGSAQVLTGGVNYPAVLYIGWSGSLFAIDEKRYTVYIKNSSINFYAGLNNASGTLYYYRRPLKIGNNTSHTDFTDQCFDAIIQHAAAMLQQKDWGQCSRFLKNVQDILKVVTTEPTGMYPRNLNENTDA